MEFIKNIIPYISYLWVAIVLVAVWAWFYINRQKDDNKLIAKRHWIEMIPSAVSTLGVLGTFFGITLGLLCFNPKDLTTSIPDLLDGLKTAFFTSLAGMVGSLVLSKRINNLYDKESGGVSDINQAAGVICKSVSDFQAEATRQAQAQSVFYNLIQTVIQKMDANIATMNANVSSLNTAANEMALQLKDISTNSASVVKTSESIKDGVENIDNSASSLLTSIGNIEETAKSGVEVTKEIHRNVSEMADHTEAMVSTEGEVSEKITNLTDKLHGEVIDIEDKMAETSALLERKFDEFSELLKKNNTEALVEVMKRVTEEFQAQMNALISKLVQENFAQLNKSVEKLNQWQQENKAMIQSLTSQYKQMAENFENTSTSLDKVKDDTKLLVSDGGKLEQLVNSLSEIIIHDQKFKEISTNLQKTADLSKSNMESFDQSTRQLNEWVKTQMHFRDDVTVLIKKLEEINEMRNYASKFWAETKQGMNDAVGIVRNGSEQLNNQLTNLDEQFYERLSTTLANLDACIQSLVNKAGNNAINNPRNNNIPY